MFHAVKKPFACGQTVCNKSDCDHCSLRRPLEKDQSKLKIDPSELNKRNVSYILFKTAVAGANIENKNKENGVPPILQACFTNDKLHWVTGCILKCCVQKAPVKVPL